MLTLLAAAVAVIALVLLARARFALTEARIAAGREAGALQSRAEAAEEEHAALTRIMNGVGEAIVAIDSEHHVVLANRSFIDLFRFDTKVTGRQIGELIRYPAVFNAFERALQGFDSTEQFAVKLGVAERKIEMRAFPIEGAGIAAVALFIDVTQLERLEQIRRSFIADFSHEVRTPLTGLRSAVESFETENLAPDDEKQLRRIMARQLLRLEHLVDDLSELSRIESGEVKLDLHPVDLRTLVDEVREELADTLAQHRIDFLVEGGPAIVNADPVRLQQAISNLIDNAVKYGGDDKTIRVSIEARDVTGVLRVSDEGEGIPPGERENIFRRFYRVDKSRSQDVSGTGLGLAITKHLVLRHGGTIDVESEVGKGSTFVVMLPK